MPERTLDRLIRIGLAAVAVGVVVVAVIYFLDRGDKGESLVDRRISAAEKAVREKPEDIGTRLALADMYRAAKRPGDALGQYDEVLRVKDHQSTAMLGRGEVLAEEGKASEAITAFEQVIGKADKGEFSGVDPQLEAAYYGLGSVRLEQGKAKQARQSVEKAVRIEPGDADAWYLLGRTALKSGAAKRAVKALREAVLFVPTGWCDPYKSLSAAYAALGQEDGAKYAKAMVDFCEERPEEAERRLKSLTNGPTAVDAMLGLGMVAEAQSDRKGARHWYRRVLASDAGNFNARSGLKRLAGVREGG